MHNPANPGKNGVSSQWLLTLCALVLACLLPTGAARGQCEARWLAVGEGGIPGTNGPVYAMTMWDPDGAGPQPPVLLIGGAFTMAGTTPAVGIAMWDGHAWSAIGAGAWTAGTYVRTIAVAADGTVLVGGRLSFTGGVAGGGVAQWNGSSWQAVGDIRASNWVSSLAFLPNGDLVAGGNGIFTPALSFPSGVARWDGRTWTPMGLTQFADGASSLLLTSAGDLIGVGYNLGVRRWDGTAWQTFGSPSLTSVTNVAIASDGVLVIGGSWGAATLIGSTWTSLGVNGRVSAIQPQPDGDLLVGGNFTSVGTTHAANIALRHAGVWSGLGPGLTGSTILVNDILSLTNGDLVAVGLFTSAGGISVSNLAVWGSPCRCPADLDNGAGFGSASSAKDGGVTIDDLLFFVAAFSAGDLRADLDDGTETGTRDGAVTVEDLAYFLEHFQSGC